MAIFYNKFSVKSTFMCNDSIVGIPLVLFFSVWIKNSRKLHNICSKHRFLVLLFKEHHKDAKFNNGNHFTQYVPLSLMVFNIYTVIPWFTLILQVNQGVMLFKKQKSLFFRGRSAGPQVIFGRQIAPNKV